MDETCHSVRYANALIGGAAGDAWGYQVEFIKYPKMPAYPVSAPAGEWVISDDTQMLLATHNALHDVVGFDDIDEVAEVILDRYLDWAVDPDNTRAPGSTCLSALWNIERGQHWNRGGARYSAGCGAVMRLAPAAFAPPKYRRGLAVLQAVVTHRHPKAALSALLLCDAFTIAGQEPLLEHARADLAVLETRLPDAWADDDYLQRVLALLTDDPHTYLSSALGIEPGRSGPSIEAAFTAAAERLVIESHSTGWAGDPCAGIGEGWDAATATVLGMLAADLHRNGRFGPVEAIAWASTSNGDSDSIATIAGALIGAASTDPGFWGDHRLGLCLEPRYADEIDTAAQQGPPAGGGEAHDELATKPQRRELRRFAQASLPLQEADW
ncbi:MAG: glycohydrolase [Gordonia sp. (in: high G+C Gram-positive bacteria)]|nr:MAG: glycohydrolase [Gordonia sp. (in: high G+C Gram-positive bacteria)]